jgi:hypothetical protein
MTPFEAYLRRAAFLHLSKLKVTFFAPLLCRFNKKTGDKIPGSL